MRTSIHNDIATRYVVKVTPTMEALGDQPYICEVTRIGAPTITETMVVEASYRFIAARRAIRKFAETHEHPEEAPRTETEELCFSK